MMTADDATLLAALSFLCGMATMGLIAATIAAARQLQQLDHDWWCK